MRVSGIRECKLYWATVETSDGTSMVALYVTGNDVAFADLGRNTKPVPPRFRDDVLASLRLLEGAPPDDDFVEMDLTEGNDDESR
jgi:hypothetical protein